MGSLFSVCFSLADWQMTLNAPVHLPCGSAREIMCLKSKWALTNFIALSCFMLTHKEGTFLEKSSAHDCSCSVAACTTPSVSTHAIPASPRLTQCFLSILWKHLGSLCTPSHRLTQSSDHKPTAAPSDEVAPSCSSCWRRQLSKCLCEKLVSFSSRPYQVPW